LKLDKSNHAPGTQFFLEIGNRVRVGSLIAWSNLGVCVLVQLDTEKPRWFMHAKIHAVEFIRVVGWEEFTQLIEQSQPEATLNPSLSELIEKQEDPKERK